MISRFNGGEYYRPTASAVTAVKRSRINPLLESRLDPCDLGFAAIRRMSFALSASDSIMRGGFFDACTAHVDDAVQLRPSSDVANGVVLVTHPIACLTQPTLHHAVIILFKGDGDSVLGVVINKSTEVVLGDLESQLGADGRQTYKALLQCRLHKGGDVEHLGLLALFECPLDYDSPHGIRIAPDLMLTADVAGLADEIHRGTSGVTAERTKLLLGHCAWSLPQLQLELQRHVWFPAVADSGLANLALAGIGDRRYSSERQMEETLWSGTVRQLGRSTANQGFKLEFEELAKFPSDHDRLWRVLGSCWEAQTSELMKRLG